MSYKAKLRARRRKYAVITNELRKMGFTEENIREMEKKWDTLL